MSPVTPAMFATLFDKEQGIDGNMYVATLVNGAMTWVLDSSSTGGNKRGGSSKTKKHQQRSKMQEAYMSFEPDIPPSDSFLFNFEPGLNGDMYVNNLVNGNMTWELPNINHDWNNCVTCDISFDNIDMSQASSKKKGLSGRTKKNSLK